MNNNHYSGSRNLRRFGLQKFILPIALSMMGAVCAFAEVQSADIFEFKTPAEAGADATSGVRAALEHCRTKGIHRLAFAPGRYDFWPDRAQEKYLFVSNNDEGLKRIAFPLTGFDGMEIDGRGATFVFHGYIVPFLVENSRNVAIKNLSVDFARTFHSEGKVLAVTQESVDLEISEEFPYAIRQGILIFTDGKSPIGPQTTVKSGEVLYPYGNLLAFDPVRRETAYMAKDRYAMQDGLTAREIGPRQVRLTLPKASAEPGNILVFGAAHRDIPGIIVSDSAKTLLEDLSIYHCGGMGVIAQRSSDLDLEKVRVTPAPGGRRIVSVTADATHFVNCTGKITMRDCLFENQKDDATNIHGLYARIEKIVAPDKMEVRLVHPEQFGLDFIRPGTRLEIVDGPSLETRGETVAKAVERINKEITVVTTAAPLPATVREGNAVANADANTAEVLIENCVIRNNRARGILLGSRGKVTVVGNTFHTPGAAILFEGDARFWFEQAGVREVTIRGNTFDNCNFGVWGKACIEVGSGIEKSCQKTSRYNRNITIENNLFRVFGPRSILSVYSVDGLKFRNNRLERTHAYPPQQEPMTDLCRAVDSDRIAIEPPIEVSGMTANSKGGFEKNNPGQ